MGLLALWWPPEIMALLTLIFTNTNQIIAALSSQTSIRSTVLVFRGTKLVHWPSREGVWEGNGRRSLDQSRLRLAVAEKRERLSSALYNVMIYLRSETIWIMYLWKGTWISLVLIVEKAGRSADGRGTGGPPRSEGREPQRCLSCSHRHRLANQQKEAN